MKEAFLNLSTVTDWIFIFSFWFGELYGKNSQKAGDRLLCTTYVAEMT